MYHYTLPWTVNRCATFFREIAVAIEILSIFAYSKRFLAYQCAKSNRAKKVEVAIENIYIRTWNNTMLPANKIGPWNMFSKSSHPCSAGVNMSREKWWISRILGIFKASQFFDRQQVEVKTHILTCYYIWTRGGKNLNCLAIS